MGPFWFLVVTLVLAWATTGHAQTGGPGGGQGGGAGAPPDSVKARPVFGFLIPTYSSTYSVNRGESAWLQSFKFSNDWRGFSIKNDTQYTIKTDPKRADFKVRQGNTNNSLSYLVLDRIPVTGAFDYSRSGTTDTGRENSFDQLDTNIGTDYHFKVRRFVNYITGQIGLTNRTDSQLLQGNRLTTNDLGLSRKLSAGTYLGGLLEGMTIKLDGKLQVDGSNAKATEGTGVLLGSVSPVGSSGGVPKAYVQVIRGGTLDIVAADSTGNTLTPDGLGRRYSFPDLQPGRYDVRFTSPGYETITRSALVQVEQTTDLGDTPLSRGYTSAFAQIELAGDLVGPGSDYIPTVRARMTNSYGGVWQVEVNNVSSGEHRFKFTTGDARGDYGGEVVGCAPGLTTGPVKLGGNDALCASFAGGGAFRITLDEEALRFRVERLRPDESGPTNNLNRDATLAITYAPFEAFSTDLTLTGGYRADSYIIVNSGDPTLKGRREKVSQKTSNLAFNMGFHPPALKTTEVQVKVTRTFTGIDKLVDVDRASEATASSVDARLRHRLLGNQLNLHFEQDNNNDRPRSRVSSKTLTRVIDGAVDRPMGPRITARGAGELRLRRQNYADLLQDQDGLRSKLEMGMTYRPDSSLTGTVVASRTLDDSRNINSQLSQNSRYEERYTVSFGIDWAVTKSTTLTQKYNYQPAFTTFQFDSPKDNLLRNRDVTTTVTTLLNPRLTLTMKHVYQLQESGGYRRDENGTRLFAVGGNLYVQDLTTSLAWRPLAWLNFYTDERFNRRDQVDFSKNSRAINSRLELSQSANFQRPLPGGGLIQVDFKYFVQASLKPVAGRRENYIMANVTLNKTF